VEDGLPPDLGLLVHFSYPGVIQILHEGLNLGPIILLPGLTTSAYLL
jgi:hypothetical protein